VLVLAAAIGLILPSEKQPIPSHIGMRRPILR